MKKLILTLALGTLSLSSYSQSVKDTIILPYVTQTEFIALKNNVTNLNTGVLHFNERVTIAGEHYITQTQFLVLAFTLSMLGSFFIISDPIANYTIGHSFYIASTGCALVAFTYRIKGNKRLANINP